MAAIRLHERALVSMAKMQKRIWEEQTLSIMGTWPISRTDSCQSPWFTLYSNRILSLPLYVACRSLHSAGKMLRFLSANLFAMGSVDLSRNTSRTLTLNLFLCGRSSGCAFGSPSRKTLVPMSLIVCSRRPPWSSMALKEWMWGSMAAAREGYAV